MNHTLEPIQTNDANTKQYKVLNGSQTLHSPITVEIKRIFSPKKAVTLLIKGSDGKAIVDKELASKKDVLDLIIERSKQQNPAEGISYDVLYKYLVQETTHLPF